MISSPYTNSGALSLNQITASRDRLLSEGFHISSKAVRVHDQLLADLAAYEVSTNAAVRSIEELKAECERWQDIRTAPKDGTRLLLYFPFDNAVYAAIWWMGEWQVAGGMGASLVDDKEPRFVPTHWMPLPQPPESEVR